MVFRKNDLCKKYIHFSTDYTTSTNAHNNNNYLKVCERWCLASRRNDFKSFRNHFLVYFKQFLIRHYKKTNQLSTKKKCFSISIKNNLMVHLCLLYLRSSRLPEEETKAQQKKPFPLLAGYNWRPPFPSVEQLFIIAERLLI